MFLCACVCARACVCVCVSGQGGSEWGLHTGMAVAERSAHGANVTVQALLLAAVGSCRVAASMRGGEQLAQRMDNRRCRPRCCFGHPTAPPGQEAIRCEHLTMHYSPRQPLPTLSAGSLPWLPSSWVAAALSPW